MRCSSMAQRALYNVAEAYVLETDEVNDSGRELVVHQNALPKVLDWPPIPYYTYRGKYLHFPECWIGPPEVEVPEIPEFDFSSKSPIIPFRHSKKTRIV